jgi:sRNA-binding carbon storage regulator CsrA/DNA-binding Xre family transcriptional regulator
MLLLTRRAGQSITIQPGRAVAPNAPVATLFAQGPIQILVNRILAGEVKLGIHAHDKLTILREEIAHRYPFDPGPARHAVRQGESGLIRDILARNVYRQRRRRQWSLEQLSVASGLSQTTLTAIEHGTGEITLDDLDGLALAFELSVAELLIPGE